MLTNKQLERAELELIEGLRASEGNAINTAGRSGCSMPFDLDRFRRGKCRSLEASLILTHVGHCGVCAEYLRNRRARTVRIRRTLLIASAAAIIIAIFLTSSLYRPAPQGLAVIDLRELAATRGTEALNTSSISIPRSAAHLKFLLPIGSEGHYDCSFARQGTADVEATTSGDAVVANGKVVLTLTVNLERLTRGDYTLTLRRAGSQSTEYPVNIK